MSVMEVSFFNTGSGEDRFLGTPGPMESGSVH